MFFIFIFFKHLYKELRTINLLKFPVFFAILRQLLAQSTKAVEYTDCNSAGGGKLL